MQAGVIKKLTYWLKQTHTAIHLGSSDILTAQICSVPGLVSTVTMVSIALISMISGREWQQFSEFLDSLVTIIISPIGRDCFRENVENAGSSGLPYRAYHPLSSFTYIQRTLVHSFSQPELSGRWMPFIFYSYLHYCGLHQRESHWIWFFHGCFSRGPLTNFGEHIKQGMGIHSASVNEWAQHSSGTKDAGTDSPIMERRCQLNLQGIPALLTEPLSLPLPCFPLCSHYDTSLTGILDLDKQ